MQDDDELVALDAEALLNARLRSKLQGLQRTRQALVEGLGPELAAARERERQDRARIEELEGANAVLERRLATMLRDRARAQEEQGRIASVANGLQKLKACAEQQQVRLLEAEAEAGRLQGVEADAIGLKEELAEAMRELADVKEERDRLLGAARAWEGERGECVEHAEAFLTTLVRLAARRPPVSLPAGDGDGGRRKRHDSDEAEVRALLETFFPLNGDNNGGGSSTGRELWGSLRGLVEEVSRLLAAHWRAQARAAAEAERATSAEVERQLLQARAEEAEARLAQLAGDWEEVRAAARGLEPMVGTLRDNLIRAEQRVAELREELGGRDRLVGAVLERLLVLTGAGEEDAPEHGAGLSLNIGLGLGTGLGDAATAAAASAASSILLSSVEFVEMQVAISSALTAAAERMRALQAHHLRAAGEGQRREGELQRLAADFARLSVEHRETTAALARRAEAEGAMEAVVGRQKEELAAVRARLEAAEREVKGLREQLATAVAAKEALQAELAWADVALKGERAQARQRFEELTGWQRYAQRQREELADVQRSLQQGVLGPAAAPGGGGGLRGLIGSPQRARSLGGSAASCSRF